MVNTKKYLKVQKAIFIVFKNKTISKKNKILDLFIEINYWNDLLNNTKLLQTIITIFHIIF